MIISEQIAFAERCYNKLRVLDPNVFLAGGAPFNWYHGKDAKDLDFWLTSPANTWDEFEHCLKMLGFGDIKSLTSTNSAYSAFQASRGIQFIADCCVVNPVLEKFENLVDADIDNIRVQVICFYKPYDRSNAMQGFDCDVCRIKYDFAKKDYIMTSDVFTAMASKVCTFKRKSDLETDHGKRVQAKLLGLDDRWTFHYEIDDGDKENKAQLLTEIFSALDLPKTLDMI